MRIETEDQLLRSRAQELASRLRLRVVADSHDRHDDEAMTLAMRDEGLELREAGTAPGRGMTVDLAEVARAVTHDRSSLSRRQPLARAMGPGARNIIDATMGLGHDAVLLAAMGYNVLAIERNDILHEMLDIALHRALKNPVFTASVGERLRLHRGDARTLLTDAGREFHDVDCIYLDPMFPPKRRRSALAKKEIRLVRMLAGDDEDAAELLAVARSACRRVAVKRPHHVPALAPDVTGTIHSTLVRYDIYIDATKAPVQRR